jgi:receptor-binding and translocation channel-forming TcA subunit of Tc toxin/ABC toxin-like protein/neuraminidase-like protein
MKDARGDITMATGDKKLIRITGRVIERKTKQGLSNLRVEAWDKDLIVKDAVGAATTDQQGGFVIELAKGRLKELFADRHVLLFFKVFRDDQLISSTEESVLWDRDAPDSEVVIKVKIESPTLPDSGSTGKTFTVSGQVRRADGSAFKDGFVQVLLTIQGKQRMLGETKTDPNGQFEIAYTLDESQAGQLANVRVVARVFDSQRIQLAESPSFIPDTTVTVNLTVPNPPPPPDETLSVQGQVRSKDGTPISKAIVRAFITTPEKELLLGEAKTDSSGSYKITSAVDPSLFSQPARAQLEARVFDKKGTHLGTSSSPIKERSTTVDVVVSTTTQDKIFTIHGRVLRNEKPVADVTVQIFGVLPGPEEPLGDPVITDSEGGYEIQYNPGRFDGDKDQNSRVQLRVSNDQRRELFKTPAFSSEAEILLDMKIEDHVEPRLSIVRGRITRQGGGRFDGIARVFSIASGKQLGNDALTGDLGQYEISYEAAKLSGTVDIGELVIVRVFDKPGRERAHSTQFNAEPLKVIDLEVDPLPDDGQTFVVQGRVTQAGNIAFVGGIVRVFSISTGTQLGTDARTDDSGRYRISYKAGKLSATVDIGELVIVRVFDDLRRERAHSETFNAQPLKEVNLEVVPLPSDEKTFVVEGRVTLAGDIAFAGGIVRAFDRDLRNEERLGESPTNVEGHYEIRYSANRFLHSEKGTADLIVRAVDAGGSQLATSPTLFNAPASAHIDLTIPADKLRPPSLFERIAAAVAPLLDGVRIEDLEENQQNQDVSFLSGETGFDKTDIARFIIAHKPALQSIRAEFWFVLLGRSFFQFAEDQSLQDQLNAVLDSLSSLDDASVRKSLTRGFNQQEIPVTLSGRVDEWVGAFLDFLAKRLVSGGAQPTFLLSALEDAKIKDAGKQQRFALLFNQNNGLTPALLDALQKDGTFSKTEIDDLHTSFNLADLTNGDFSIVKMIKDQFRVRQPEAIRALAKNSQSDWVNLVTTKHAAGQINLPFETADISGVKGISDAEVYGKSLESQFRTAFPTTAFAGGLGRALNTGGVRGLRHADALNQFLDQHQDFELLNTPVDDFLENNLNPNSRALAANEDFAFEVKKVQRVFKLAPTFAATDTLLADDVHSALQIYRIGETGFVQRYSGEGLTPEDARTIWNRAADTHAAVITVVGALKGLQSDTLPVVLQNGTDALSTFPNWNNLFKTGDICECEHCRSVLGPAAYFADLLMFLKERKAANPASTVKDILFRRRPDLGYLELNCENALTPLPYIDVVCEVLEDLIAAGANDVELTGFIAMPADAVAAKSAVAAALSAKNISLGADFSLTQVDPSDPNRWVAHGDDATCLLKKKGTPNFFAEALRNTKTGADELRAYPQYVNPKAYEKLRAAKYPLALPFDLFAEEVRAAFQKPNLQRWDLMQTLRGSASPNNPSDGDVAAEYFGISSDPSLPTPVNPSDPTDEKRIILTAAPTNAWQKVFWGELAIPGGVSNVKVFLQKTGLEYNDLLTLLDLEFINPAHDITIHHQDASCDTDKKDIQALDATKLDRIHRFLRLYRKLTGWKTWELDLVIRHPAIGNGSLNEAFLINLMYFVEAKNRLAARVTVEQVSALFGDLNIKTRFTKLHEKREDALYQNLFLNRRLINPIDAAFQINGGTGDLTAGQAITAHHPVVLSALGIREADLVLLKGLTKATDGSVYLNDNLTLANLSFLWRHAWLAKLLKFKAEEWKVVLKVAPQDTPAFPNLTAARDFLEKKYFIKAATLTQAEVDKLLAKIFHQDLFSFACPKSALEFLEKIDQLKATGFKADELNWLLAADRAAKAAVKESDAVRFLTGLRKDLQGIHAEYDPGKYPFLTPPIDEEQLVALLTSLLQKLNRDEAAVQFFIGALKGEISQERTVAALPAGFIFPAVITGAPNNIAIHYDPALRFSGAMTAAQRTVLLTDPSLAAVTGLLSYQQAIQDLFQQAGRVAVTNLPAGFTFPAPITGAPNNIPIRYEPVLRFNGLMTAAQRATLMTDPSLAAVTGIASYRGAIEGFFTEPRLALKFYDPVFTAPLGALPPAIDFKAQLPADLAAKISYDPEQHLLRFAGIMRTDEQAALNALVPNVLPVEVAYHNAVNSLATQPQTIASPDKRVWLSESDLDASQLANDTFAKRLANAAQKALGYLSTTLAENLAVQQCGDSLGLTAATARAVMTRFQLVPPDSALAIFTGGVFSNSTGAISYAIPYKDALDTWYWLNRVARVLKQWKIDFEDLEHLINLTTETGVIDFGSLPLEDTPTHPIAPIDKFLRTNRLLRLRDTLIETKITLFEVLEKLNLEKLNAGAYPSGDFADDIELLNEAWTSADVFAFISAVDLAYPTDYFLAESWERLRLAFYFLENLNAGVNVVKTFAAATMTDAQAKTLKELLRSKFGSETWLTLSAEIQDVLRERKRDALAAYLLTQPKPADAPTGKWENTNDLYAYYLLDVEMSACQLTSRLVQGSGSIQLFVQRCFMGLEPEVTVRADGADGDSAWRWWKWMRKYRVWEANRKVFLWPENWIEPELKKDRSSFFKDLENELLQNEINQFTVETAFSNYLEKLDGVAQLEIAGFYQEDDGDNAIVHVFGRTVGAEPHLYYYRRYDYRQWTPWEKVDLDIQGDYLIPAVVNKRLFLFWPVFTETPDEAANSTVKIPRAPGPNETSFSPDKTKKRLKLQMAVSDYRQGKWTPKRISKDFDQSSQYEVEIVRKHYRFFPMDRSEVDGRFGIKYDGYSSTEKSSLAFMSGAFEIAGCKGVPEKASLPGHLVHAFRPEFYSTLGETSFLKWVELGELGPRIDSPQNDFTLETYASNQPPTLNLTSVLTQTPGIFKMSPPWHLAYFDKLLLDGLLAFVVAPPMSVFSRQEFVASVTTGGLSVRNSLTLIGTWLPYFYNDKKRTFFVLPSLVARKDDIRKGPINLRPGASFVGGGDDVIFTGSESVRSYYPEIKKNVRKLEDYFEGLLQTWLDGLTFSTLTPTERQRLGAFLRLQFPEEIFPDETPPSTDQNFKDLIKRFVMRFYHKYLGALSLSLFQLRHFHFKNFYHPFVCDFGKLVHNPLKGIPALMSRSTQLKDSGFSFRQTYQPTTWVVEPPTESLYPKEIVDFSPDGAYSSYNWELFFHAPLFIANSLSKNQRFEEARDWYHFIFNPIGVESATPGGSPMSKYWITKPFFATTDLRYIKDRIDNILRMLAGDASVPGFSAQAKKDLEDQVLDWRTNPFEPHRIANYRTVAYQKTVVMKYLDNLIAWGDYLFRQDSMESINEATQLYILAAEILGPRPKKMPAQAKPPLESFNELEKEFDKFSNALVEVENLVPPLAGNLPNDGDLAPLPMLYFCIPQNDKMVGYWDTVADRLFKIRHCMNIEGVARQLALFEPPIDPAALVKAVAGGVDIASALADLNAPLPLYRFNVLLQKANEVCNDVKSLGGALLAALEKKDSEEMGLLRQGQEIRMLEAVRSVREKQVEEAKENLAGVKKSKATIETRRNYYRDIERLTTQEQLHLDKMGEAHNKQEIAQGIKLGASIVSILPAINLGASGFGGSPLIAAKIGGLELGQAANLASDVLSFLSQIASNDASMASSKASFDRRWEDWKLQERLADKELAQLDSQIAAAELRIAIAEKELENHVLQIENAKAIDDFMHSKYTNQELYQWQVGQISGVYFQSYKLAYDLAKRAERCFRFELGLQDSSYINFGYWDSLKKGLLSGEKLQYDLRRLETAYLDQNRRELELTKHVSLVLLDPLALIRLRETGRCFFRLPEEILDLDYPGHYFRRIKSVSLTVPCVVGPYTTISCTLRLLKNSIRLNTANGDNGYPRNIDDQGLPADDPRFIENNIPVKAVATSNAQNDSGVFEMSFRDERYLPFEGAGAVSEWSLELFNDSNADFGKPLRQFDYATIVDAILHVKYTAREDVGAFKNSAVAHLRDYFGQDDASPSLQLFNLRQEFPTEWHRFLNPTTGGNVFELPMSSSLFPFRDEGKTLKVNSIWLLARCTDAGSYTAVFNPPLPVPPDSNKFTLAKANQFGGLHFSQKDVAALGVEIAPADPPVNWQLTVTRPGGDLQKEVKDMLLVLGYEWQ